MKQKTKQLILTLVALLALTTGAWAQGKLIYEKDFSSDTYYPFYLDAADKTGASATVTNGLLVLTNPSVQTTNWDVQPEIGRLTSATPITQGNTYRVVMQYKTTKAGSVTFALGSQQDWNIADWRGQTITISDEFQTCEAYFNNYPYSIAESHILLQFGELVGTITVKKVEVYELYPFPITWDTTAKTGTFTMPGGNVYVTPEYYDEAAFAQDNSGETPVTLAPKANNSAKANTDDPLVEGGTVANIVEATEVLDAKQGKLLYHVSTTELTNAQLEALDPEDDWSETVPTADGYTFETATDVYVYYYIKGADDVPGNAAGSKFTFSDTEIQKLTVNVQPEPTYAVTFADDLAEPTLWTADPNTGVKKGQTVTVTYTGTKKVLGVKAEKKAAALIVNPEVGQVIGSDGKNYAYASLPTGVTAVAKICYVSGSNGLALALTDEESKMNWSTAIETCAAHTPAITGGTWKLATKDEWSNMITAAGSHTALRDGFSSVGGTNMKEDYPYWSSTEDGSDNVWIYSFSYGIWSKNNNSVGYVRACLAF